MITQIKKRNGNIVPFDKYKISNAMRKAFESVNVPIADEKIEEMMASVVATLEANYNEEKLPAVEGVQDTVEKTLMQGGYFDVAKVYILYRYEHAKIREKKKEEVLQQIEDNKLYVVKRSGKREKFSIEKIKKTLSFFTEGNPVDIETVARQCELEVFDGMTTQEVARTLIMVLRSMMEQDPAYSKVAARLLLDLNYKEAFQVDSLDYQNLETEYRSAFVRNMHRGVATGRLDKRLLGFDLENVAKKLVISRDDFFVYLGLQTLYDRYFLRDDETKKVLETPQMFWMRIAMGSAILEKDKEARAEEFYGIMSDFYYTPSTPTLFHAGTAKPQLSSCFLNMVPDSLDAIFKSYTDNAQLSKWSGGIGTAWTHLRATGAFIKGTGVESNGIIPFLKIANDVTVAINRSGRRRGAACVYLENWHYDFPDFMELRKNTGDERRRTHDMDTAGWISDLFMKRVLEDGQWTLFSPDEAPDLVELYGKKFEEAYKEYERKADTGEIKLWRRMPASELWKKMLAMLYETGHPWITFKDPSNIRSPQDHSGVIHSSNLCTEITLNTSPNETAVCNLGSLNFAKFVRDGVFDRNAVARVVPVAMRMLDNVIDINFYPTQDGKRSNYRHRPVGLGIRGFQDALYLLDVRFDSEEAVRFADASMELISYHAIMASSELAKERGTYSTYKGSKWDRGILPHDTIDLLAEERGREIPIPRGGELDWKPVREHIAEHGMRNSNCLAIAPTATTANIVGCFPSIEPAYKNLYVKANQAGDFVLMNTYLVDELKALGLWSKTMVEKIKYYDGSIQDIEEIPEEIRAKFKEVFEIETSWLIRQAAYRGKWIDQSQSLNIFFGGTSGKELSDIYLHVWDLGLKTTYYLRTLAASQVEKSTLKSDVYGTTHLRKQREVVEPVATPIVEIVAVSAVATSTLGEGEVCESCQA
ncbi:MAG: ribonucleoside-diphosphate reductase subunit alpha [bacterium]|nr:ribonucleoside-diphosphate reductase subunit alpha [bacterium]